MDWGSRKNCVLVAGFAQLPKGTTLYEIQKVIGCVLVIDKETKVIADASFTFVMGLTNDFISSMVKGKSIETGIQEVIDEIEERFVVPPQRAVIQALRAAYERYTDTFGIH